MYIKFTIMLTCLSLLMACSAKRDQLTQRRSITKTTLNYASAFSPEGNLDEIHPFKIKDDLLQGALYNTLLDSVNGAPVLSGVFFDSLSNKYTFTLNHGIRFSNGDTLKTSDILKLYKYTIDTVRKSAIADKFRKNIKGYQSYLRRRQYKLYKDALPEGIEAISSSKFSISLIKPDENFLSLLNHGLFTINKHLDGKYYGTGEFYIESGFQPFVLKRSYLNFSADEFSIPDKVVFHPVTLNTAADLFDIGKIDLLHYPVYEKSKESSEQAHGVFARSNVFYTDASIGVLNLAAPVKQLQGENPNVALIKSSYGNPFHAELMILGTLKKSDPHVDDILLSLFDGGKEDFPTWYKSNYEFSVSLDTLLCSKADSSYQRIDLAGVYPLTSMDSLTVKKITVQNPSLLYNNKLSRYTKYVLGSCQVIYHNENDLKIEIEAKMDSLFTQYPVKNIKTYLTGTKPMRQVSTYDYVVFKNDKIALPNVLIQNAIELR